MGVLTGPEIERRIACGDIGFDPPPQVIGPNSADVRLGPAMLVYADTDCLDPHRNNPVVRIEIPPHGLVLAPGRLYLGHTLERVRCRGVVPYIDGRSSVGRVGLSVHVTAGRGDDGWDGQFTLELWCVQPVRVRAGDRIAQVAFHEVIGSRRPYRGRYQGSAGPVASRFREGGA